MVLVTDWLTPEKLLLSGSVMSKREYLPLLILPSRQITSTISVWLLYPTAYILFDEEVLLAVKVHRKHQV